MSVCVCFGLPSNASHPFTLNMEGIQKVMWWRPESGNTHLEAHRTDVFLERATVYWSLPVAEQYVAWDCVFVSVWSCKQALLMKWRWSRESCSDFRHNLFIRPLCGTYTHSHTCTRGDRKSAVYSITHQRSTSFPHPCLSTPPSLNHCLLPSLKSMECFVTQCCVSCNIHLKKKANLTLTEFS